jgi:hypothetical protein
MSWTRRYKCRAVPHWLDYNSHVPYSYMSPPIPLVPYFFHYLSITIIHRPELNLSGGDIPQTRNILVWFEESSRVRHRVGGDD